MSSSIALTQLEQLPAGLLEVTPTELDSVLTGCTLIHLPGRRERPLFVSVLLHGNETTGLQAIQRLLRRYADRPLPRALSLFFGNIEAASEGVRRLDRQLDYNRIWPGTECGNSPEATMARQVVREMARRDVMACVDVHNNTGMNPHYACVDRLDRRTLQLAALFSRLCIHSTRPKGTCSAAFSRICPSVTLECGKPGHAFGAEHAVDYLEACLQLSQLPDHPVADHDLDLYESVAQVCVTPGIEFGFGAEGTQVDFIPELDRLNFRPVPADFAWAQVRTDGLPIRVLNDDGMDVSGHYFRVEEGRLLSNKAVMPSMLTLDAQAIRLDCLCYLMERLDPPDDRVASVLYRSGRGSD